MRKPLKYALRTLAVVVALPVLTLMTTAIINAVATNVEVSGITSYGTLVPVDGKQMNVVDRGTGDRVIVLLPGLGTAAPALDFEPLIAELAADARVIAVEPFGSGLSDQTDVPRTTGNIVDEVHEAVQSLGVDHYVLMGHSIAGLYALEYSARYGDELTAFVGIDTSVPGQPGSDETMPTEGLTTLRDLGILRALAALSPDPLADLPHDDILKDQMHRLSTRNGTAPTLLDEMARAASNFAALQDAHFPADLPVLLFVANEDAELAGWVELHEQQAASVENGAVILTDGGHYLHHTASPEIAAQTSAFLDAAGVR